VGASLRKPDGSSVRESFDENEAGQKRALEIISKFNMEKKKVPNIPKILKGPERVEVTYVYRKTPSIEWSMLVYDAEAPSDTNAGKGYLFGRGFITESSIQVIPSKVCTSKIYVRRVRKIGRAVSYANSSLNFGMNERENTEALKHVASAMKAFSDADMAAIRSWMPVQSSTSSQSVHTPTNRNWHYNYNKDSTFFRASGDEEGLSILVQQIKNFQEGKRLLSLPPPGGEKVESTPVANPYAGWYGMGIDDDI